MRIAVGIRPRTVPDLVYHGTIVVVLVRDLILAARTRSPAADQRA